MANSRFICACPACTGQSQGTSEAEKPGPNGPSDAKPTYTLDQIITQLTTSWGGSAEGHTMSWDKQTVTYSMPTTAPTTDPDHPVPLEAGGLTQMTAAMKDAARLAFELWDDLIAINLTESANDPAADITFNYSLTADGTSATPILENYDGTDHVFAADQIWVDATHDSTNSDADLAFNKYGFKTYVHEIGHALGLSHPGSYNGEGHNYADDAEFAQDNRQFTLMSYFGGYSSS